MSSVPELVAKCTGCSILAQTTAIQAIVRNPRFDNCFILNSFKTWCVLRHIEYLSWYEDHHTEL
jgi:hypothetical protein